MFLCDLTSDKLVDSVPEGSADLASMIFVLSAITPEKMVGTLRNVHSVSLSHLSWFACVPTRGALLECY